MVDPYGLFSVEIDGLQIGGNQDSVEDGENELAESHPFLTVQLGGDPGSHMPAIPEIPPDPTQLPHCICGDPQSQQQSQTADSQQNGQPAQTAQNKSTNTQQVGNIVHNETGGLRPEAKEGTGSAQDLHNAKVAVADVVENRENAGNNSGVASDKVGANERKTSQYKDAQSAASEAAHSPDVTGGSKHFYLDYGQKAPSWAARKETTTYGPFKNSAGGGDVPKGTDVKIIIVHPENQQ